MFYWSGFLLSPGLLFFTWSKTLLFVSTFASLNFGVANTHSVKLRFRFLGVVDSYFSDIDIPLRTSDGCIDCMGRCCCWSIPGKYLPGNRFQHYYPVQSYPCLRSLWNYGISCGYPTVWLGYGVFDLFFDYLCFGIFLRSWFISTSCKASGPRMARARTLPAMIFIP